MLLSCRFFNVGYQKKDSYIPILVPFFTCFSYKIFFITWVVAWAVPHKNHKVIESSFSVFSTKVTSFVCEEKTYFITKITNELSISL